jgi:hypothetical protein
LILLLACTTPPSISAAYTEVDYGRFTTDADGFATIEVEVEKGDLAGTLTCGPYGFDATASLVDGGTLVTLAAPAMDAFTVGWPQAPGTPPEGLHTLTVQFASEALPLTFECSGVRRTAAVPSAGAVDVELRFAGVVGLDEENAGESETWRAVQDAVIARFATADIDLAFRYGDAATDQAYLADEAEAGALVKGEVDGTIDVVPVFLVQSMDYSPGPGHVPGWYGLGGTAASGVVVAAGTHTADPEGVAAAIVREVGHFLGLFHVEESDGTADPLDDTAPGTPNPMSRTDADGDFTDAQATILRTSVAVR